MTEQLLIELVTSRAQYKSLVTQHRDRQEAQELIDSIQHVSADGRSWREIAEHDDTSGYNNTSRFTIYGGRLSMLYTGLWLGTTWNRNRS
jgi:hypothetical protein